MYIHSKDGKILSDQCPHCSDKDTYSIIANYNSDKSKVILFHFCKSCKFYKNQSEIKFNRKIIYLDQFIISRFAKIVSGKNRDPKDLCLYSKVESLANKKKAIFPTSQFHNLETRYINDSTLRESISEVLKKISCNQEFENFDYIFETQLMQQLNKRKGTVIVDEVLRCRVSVLYKKYTCGKFRKIWAEK